jgi:hypothetical protein
MSGEISSMLPPLTPEQSVHSALVAEAVRASIEAQGGWLAFDDYLRLVLYAPGVGYYSAGSVKFGPSGDFVTAPELSGLFARCLANQCAPLLKSLGGEILELGAGTGRMAAGLLMRLAELDEPPTRYRILELSADLRARQAQTLQTLPEQLRSRVEWLDAPPEEPIAGIVLANEVLDALPFRRFVIDGELRFERGVALSAAGEFIDADRPAGGELRAELARLAPAGWPSDYVSELCPMAEPWIDSIAQSLARGVLLLIDYGLPRHEYYAAMPFPPPRPRQSADLSGPAGHHCLGGLHSRGRGRRRRATGGRGLLHAGRLPAREWHRSRGCSRARRARAGTAVFAGAVAVAAWRYGGALQGHGADA